MKNPFPSPLKFVVRLLGVTLVAALASPAIADEALVVYSGRSDKFVKPVMEAFTAATGIPVKIHAGKSTALLNKLKLEGERTTADLFISNDAGNLYKGGEFGLFKVLPEDILASVPAGSRAEDNTWVGLSARARVLVLNSKDKSVDFVRSVFDLADPRLKDKLAITHSSNESFIAGVTVYMNKAGNDKTAQWLEGMKANVRRSVYNKHSQIVRDVAEGKKAIGLVNHYYIYRHLAKHPNAPIEIRLPDQDNAGNDKAMGVAWNVAGIAVSRYSKKEKQALQLVNYLVSEKGQKQFANVNREYPVRPGIDAAPEVPAAGSFKVADVPMAELGRQRNATLDLLESVGMP